MNIVYYPTVGYSSMSVMKLRSILNVGDIPARPIMRFDDQRRRLIQTNQTLMILPKNDFERLKTEGLFVREEKGNKNEIELGSYHVRNERMPKESQEGNLYLRFDKQKKFDHSEIEHILLNWLIELENRGVIGNYRLDIPVLDREGNGKHRGYAFLRFSQDQSMEDRCVTFAMLQNRRLSPKLPNEFLSVSWVEKIPKKRQFGTPNADN